MATSLISEDCSSVSDANSLFSTEKGLLVLRPGAGCLGCTKWWFTIPDGCYAIVTRHGADLDYTHSDGTTTAVWPPGLHYPYPPWIGVSNLVTKQSIVLDLPVKACKTKDNVTVNIDVALAFRIMGDKDLGEDPELVRKFVYEVKPRGLEQQLRDAQEEAVRALARSMKHTQIYGIRSGSETGGVGGTLDDDGDDDGDRVLEGTSDAVDRRKAKMSIEKGRDVTEEMKARLNRQFIPQGIQVLSVMIKSVHLPGDITTQMSEKTMVISQNAQQRMYHEDAMQNTRMEEEVETMLQTFHEQREQEMTSGAETINAEQVKLNDSMAQASKSEANIREETNIKINNIKAENNLEVQRVKDRMHESVEKITAESEKEAAELLANTKVDTQTLLSDAELQSAKNKADADRIIAKAEGKIAPWVEKKKAYETKVREMNVYKNLSNNDDLVISGNNDEGVNLITVADSIMQNVGDPSNRSAIIAELAIIGKGSASILPTVTEA
eukprot:CAMPEP_0185735542 /NCGR_PEP_ID=MMETSP1171-20130828/25530_1 /TAXON_ID=374046 /ORGANISM="Helicotheca tamensis, Strain CCMP826" /LENGTH=495 /DNA_ID=CAMNT_0028405887 /DNA_START=1 /DNA_END=1488 /DNA_ORIENTATION=+